ncbi:MAG TPA: hypothetical protein DC053_03735 [Lachnoclostridium sp.]|nr:hypothetical protein [Lachnoclostridium sp.]
MAVAGRVLMIPAGTWTSGKNYAMLDVVIYAGSSYVAKKQINNSTVAPPNATSDWQLLAQGYDVTNVVTKSMIANNFLATDPNTVLSGPMGKSLKDQLDTVNSNFVSKFDDAIALEQQNQLIRFGKDKGNIINVSLSIASPVTWAGNPFIIATLPTEYRPRKIEYMVCYANSGVALIQIQTDGRIITYTQISNSLCYGSVVYLG